MTTGKKAALIGVLVGSAVLIGLVAASKTQDSRYPTTPPRRGRRDFGYKTRAKLSPETQHKRDVARAERYYAAARE